MPPKTKSSSSAAATAPKEEKKQKRARKDKAAPKKAKSAYIIFCSEHRDRVKEENPTAGFGDVGRILGAKWKDMSDKEKAPYLKAQEKDKIRAQREDELYKAGKYVADDDDE
ncbi:Non-histone chromosomal protein 6 [Tilletia horrida]|uniref:Non-histone chromosomal protein 6 n=1 Tax=Tilletia horrida TaxID=155126 RepID=A0AAN6JKK0_9BASI|nr:Non-histone chromosomal protein 6 [Tilletia horrida]KAK0532495.1 Non-histone chromosomal protein 6 [Tilletia horrida]KAK0539553.1 Non-histone chromosomal protein 6 [Tilletia horrida]KAK0564986.1 Non-histone chromosomal protein 6 [Tilletia horrida]